MAHFAEVVNGVVTRVLVAETAEWCEETHGGTWVQTSYNTYGNVNSREGGEALHKNFAAIGSTFDGVGFAVPQPFGSWTLNPETYIWEAPIPKPTDSLFWHWNEKTLAWQEEVIVEEEIIFPTE
jgi:hypothetical protein